MRLRSGLSVVAGVGVLEALQRQAEGSDPCYSRQYEHDVITHWMRTVRSWAALSWMYSSGRESALSESKRSSAVSSFP